MPESCEKKNGIKSIFVRHWPWILGAVFAAGSLVSMARSTATELPAVRAGVVENREDIALHDKELENHRVRIGHNENLIKEFRIEQKGQTTLLQEIKRSLPRRGPRGAGRRRPAGNTGD